MRILLTIFILLTGHNGFAGNEVDTIKVFFKMGSPVLSKTAMQYLDSLSYYNILDTRKTYLVIGYADMIGNDTSNRKLSAQRAYTVAEYLKGLGIKNIDTIVGVGEVAKPENPDGYPDDRRVDIVPYKKSKLPDISKLKKNDVFDLENMFFHGGMAVMKDESVPVLVSLKEMMQQNPGLKIRIEGHVHCFTERDVRISGQIVEDPNAGAMDEFKRLSRARAKCVYDYLIENKVDSARLQYTGLACKEMKLHPDNNRRVAIRILDK